MDLLERHIVYDSVARQQAAIILIHAGQSTPTELALKLSNPSVETARQLRYMRSVASGDKRATEMCLGVIQPIEKRDPTRTLIRPRALFLSSLVRIGSPNRWTTSIANWQKKLQKPTCQVPRRCS